MARQWAAAPAPRHQVLLFGESLDDCVAPDDPVRVLERVLREMDRGAWEERYDGRRGQPANHPR